MNKTETAKPGLKPGQSTLSLTVCFGSIPTVHGLVAAIVTRRAACRQGTRNPKRSHGCLLNHTSLPDRRSRALDLSLLRVRAREGPQLCPGPLRGGEAGATGPQGSRQGRRLLFARAGCPFEKPVPTSCATIMLRIACFWPAWKLCPARRVSAAASANGWVGSPMVGLPALA